VQSAASAITVKRHFRALDNRAGADDTRSAVMRALERMDGRYYLLALSAHD
jgi:hypothetical protein